MFSKSPFLNISVILGGAKLIKFPKFNSFWTEIYGLPIDLHYTKCIVSKGAKSVACFIVYFFFSFVRHKIWQFGGESRAALNLPLQGDSPAAFKILSYAFTY
jgi:hypothetical protein